MSFTVLKATIALERNCRGQLNEIPELETICTALAEQMESMEQSGFFLHGHEALSHNAMLAAQREFSTKHEKLDIPSDWHLELIFPEIRKMIERFDRLRVHGEQEGDTEIAVTYLLILHVHLLRAEAKTMRRFAA